jgi:lysophospholipase L1-like esterase
VFGATTISLTAFEIVLRAVGHNPFGDLLNGRELILTESSNSDVVYELTPNSTGAAWDTDVKVNSLGFRDREYVIGDRVDYRIVALGDSITFGYGLPLESTFAKQLELMFREDGKHVDVLNLGVGGYDTLQAVALLEHKGLQSENLEYIKRVRTYRASVYRVRLLQFLRARLDRLEAVIEFRLSGRDGVAGRKQRAGTATHDDADLRELIRRLESYLSVDHDYPRTLEWYASTERLDKLRYSFERLRALSNRHGFEVSVIIVPYLTEHTDAFSIAYDIVRHEAARQGFSVVEVLGEFSEIGIGALKQTPRDLMHPNELGHRVLARKLYQIYEPKLSEPEG